MNELSFYFFAWTASIAYAIVGVVAKLTSKHSIHNPWMFNFSWALFVFAFSLPVALYSGAGIPAAWANIILASLCAAVAGVFYTLALYRMDVSVLVPLFSFRSALAVIFGAMFLGEILNFEQYTYIAVIFVLGFFVHLDERLSLRAFFHKGTAFILLDIVALVLMAIFTKNAIQESGFWTASIWIIFLDVVWSLPTIYFFKKDVRLTKFTQWGLLALVAVGGVVGDLAGNKAFSANVGLSSVIISLPLSMIIAALFSWLAPHLLEKHSVKVYAIRFIAAGLMIYSAIKLTA
jgi:uncharacterized membrane protein